MSVLSRNTLATPNCQNVIDACDKAISDQKKQIEIRDLAITQSRDEISRQVAVIQDQDKQLHAWYNSKWLWLAIGAAGTAYLIKK